MYDLKEVIKEYRSSANPEELNDILPETVGGSRVHLLLGIKNTRIQPTLIKVLPSVEFLTKRHNGQDNKKQALKVYQGQCRKSEEQKEGMRIVHRDLVEKDFMTRLKDMNEDAMDYIKNGRFYIYSG